MSKINICPACNALKNGVKSRIAFEHTCELGEQNKINWDDIKRVKEHLDSLPLPEYNETNYPKIIELGEAKTVGELKTILNNYDDNVSFGFRGQPMQKLYAVNYFDVMFIVFQENPNLCSPIK